MENITYQKLHTHTIKPRSIHSLHITIYETKTESK